ncbi:MAG: glycoside hydrolase family 27 protein [Nocardioides sp.]|uniref:glycoside hydrolase family 27 protein n=1 Tax=Nocardioides sp. TaxID=35761 RepID=UPI0039E6127F
MRARRSTLRRSAVAGAVLLAATGTTLAGLVPAQAADSTATASSTASTTLAQTPPMGWNDWNSFGCDVSAELVEQTADEIVDLGLQDAGYDYVNIDDCWMTSERDADTGELVPDPDKFPDGISAVADYVHSLGLKLGIYESAGETTCQGYPGSLGHEELDAQTFADWGVDYLKYDNCGSPSSDDTAEEYEARYQVMGDALADTGRDIVYSICEWGNYEPWTWGTEAGGQLWRTTGDISDSYGSMLSIAEQNSELASYAGPGSWNDPDMLEVGNGGMTTTEYRSHFSLWSMMAAPLLIGSDLRSISKADLAILGNTDVIAVDQDSKGVQGTVVTENGNIMVMRKPLANGDVAVLLFNKSGTARNISTTKKAVGVSGGKMSLDDLWTGKTTTSSGRIASWVPAHGVAMYRVSAGGGAATHTDVTVTAPGSVVSHHQLTVRVKLRNDGPTAVSHVRTTLSLPTGWKVTDTRRHGKLTRFTVRAATATAPLTSTTAIARTSYRSAGRTHTQKSTWNTWLSTKVSAPLASADNAAGTTVTGQRSGTLGIAAGGAGVSVASSSAFGTTSASDAYGAIYRSGAFGDGSTLTAVVKPGTWGSGDQSGLMVRNHMSGSGPVGAALVISKARFGDSLSVALVSADDGGTSYNTSASVRGSLSSSTAIKLRLVRSGTDYTGSYSTDGGSTWTTVGTATLTSAAAAASQDAGVFHSSGVARTATLAKFKALNVS